VSFIFGRYVGHVKKVFESVEHKFAVPGHTCLGCDRDFGEIEQKTKETLTVCDPEPWHNLVELAKSKKPFKAVGMTQEKHFVSISQFTNIQNFRSKDVHGQPVHLHKAARITFSKAHARKMFVGYTNDMFETLQEVNVAKSGRESLKRK
jgi:hypothetical protein